MPEKVDLARTRDSYRARRGEFRVVDVPPMRYLAVDGSGDPNSSARYREALETLYPVAYALKFASKAAGLDYVVPPLEGLWWADDMTSFTTARDKSRWYWTMLLLVPEWIDDDAVDAAIAQAEKRTPLRGELRVRELDEGRCVQTLHIGSFDEEGPVLALLHDEVIPGLGLRMTGHHHEIYLSDPRRTAPERLRTILRQPVG
ncbi:GyrI-like domain-containing protein [Microbacterium sp. Marseille-Q6965]|uniref:GyrI-like domain-containing protein n=1 Tax=Microbacterium sp. Marseille-Q6965 TaxID=2965072 RepID=UPI0021B724FB|nr:GyrI-like domain-containing protein [Microbacterium sp. Marseille-Q6965]